VDDAARLAIVAAGLAVTSRPPGPAVTSRPPDQVETDLPRRWLAAAAVDRGRSPSTACATSWGTTGLADHRTWVITSAGPVGR
jgi:hypothetical protein